MRTGNSVRRKQIEKCKQIGGWSQFCLFLAVSCQQAMKSKYSCGLEGMDSMETVKERKEGGKGRADEDGGDGLEVGGWPAGSPTGPR